MNILSLMVVFLSYLSTFFSFFFHFLFRFFYAVFELKNEQELDMLGFYEVRRTNQLAMAVNCVAIMEFLPLSIQLAFELVQFGTIATYFANFLIMTLLILSSLILS